MTKTALYRHYDAAGRLLYVGISDCLSERNRKHASTSDWHSEAVRSDVEWCLSRQHAADLEKVAIRHEKPMHNKMHVIADAGESKPSITVVEITDQLGSDRIAERLKVSHHSIRHARFTGIFPSSWFDVLDTMCREEGLDCPRSAFNFKSPSAATSSEVQ